MIIEAVDTMLREDGEAWAALCAVLDANPEVNLHDTNSRPWNSRDAYAHLARWLEYNAAKIKAEVEAKPLPVAGESVEEVNARWEAKDTLLSLEEARQWAKNAYKMRKRTLEAVPISRWGAEIEKIARIEGASHFRDHLSYITLVDARPYPSATEES